MDFPEGCWGLQAGDKVVYSKYAGTDLKLGGAEHVILKVGPCLFLPGHYSFDTYMSRPQISWSLVMSSEGTCSS